jgi:hypothetical protein
MAAKKTTLKELGEMIAHVAKNMATKEEIADINIKILPKPTSPKRSRSSTTASPPSRARSEASIIASTTRHSNADLETRVRSVLPNLPPPPERV